MDSKVIGRKVSALRGKLNMSATELARRVGISQAQISRLENGKQGFRSNTLNRIAKALSVKPIYFFLEEGENESAALMGSGKLGEALGKPEFRALMEAAAGVYLDKPQAFQSVAASTRSLASH